MDRARPKEDRDKGIMSWGEAAIKVVSLRGLGEWKKWIYEALS
jgi:hypothetical protein